MAKLLRDAEGSEGSKRVRVLVVDDSALMRRLLCDLLGASAEIEVVGTARDGREAVLQAARLKPDVITLDVEMPEVSGLDALPALLAVHEAPVIMVSALTQEGADVTLQALELGAVDFMPKPERNQLAEMRACADVLISKVLTAASSRVRRIRARDQRLHPRYRKPFLFLRHAPLPRGPRPQSASTPARPRPPLHPQPHRSRRDHRAVL